MDDVQDWIDTFEEMGPFPKVDELSQHLERAPEGVDIDLLDFARERLSTLQVEAAAAAA